MYHQLDQVKSSKIIVFNNKSPLNVYNSNTE